MFSSRTFGKIVVAAALAFAPFASAAAGSTRMANSAAIPIVILGLFGFFALAALLMIGFLVFWVLMIIDCAKRDWPDKNTWLVILVLSILIQLHWLAALLYYFLIKRPGAGSAGGPAMPPQPPAA
ncbi:MAG: hypothetical protein WCT10_05345 [Patescibacteria group bacterium]|jgi:hypothetical protein